MDTLYVKGLFLEDYNPSKLPSPPIGARTMNANDIKQFATLIFDTVFSTENQKKTVKT